MSKRVYISADYAEGDGDRAIVDCLNQWGNDKLHKVDFVDMAKVVSGSVSTNNPDCRICDLKEEFNRQINASSAAIFIVGDKTSSRSAGSGCGRNAICWSQCKCTPYKHNSSGTKECKHFSIPTSGDDVSFINSYSYLRHEFEQAKKRDKKIIIIYNSTRYESNWLPSYMSGFEDCAKPFWVSTNTGEKIANYPFIKEVLGFA